MAFQPLWDKLFPVEQARIIETLVERVQVQRDHVDVVLRIKGFTSLLAELSGEPALEKKAA